MKITKRQLRRIIRESLLQEYNGHGPGSRNEPGHRDPESGDWVDPGMPGYNPEKDKTLGPDGGWGDEELEKARKAHERYYKWGGKQVRSMGPQVDKNWKHPRYR